MFAKANIRLFFIRELYNEHIAAVTPCCCNIIASFAIVVP